MASKGRNLRRLVMCFLIVRLAHQMAYQILPSHVGCASTARYRPRSGTGGCNSTAETTGAYSLFWKIDFQGEHQLGVQQTEAAASNEEVVTSRIC